MADIPILKKPDDMHPNRWKAYLIECRNRGQFYVGQLGGCGVARIPTEEINET